MADMAQAAQSSQTATDERGEQAGQGETRALPEQSGHALKMGASASIVPDIPNIVRRYAAGESMPALAAEHNVHRTTIYRWMLSETGDAHHDIVTHVLIQRVAEADAALESASDAVATSRAREQARFARMDLERRRPGLYGLRQPSVNISGNGQINVQLVSYSNNSTENDGNIISGELAAPEDSSE